MSEDQIDRSRWRSLEPARCLASSVTGFCVTMLVVGAVYTLRESARQGWLGLGYGWLALDLWSRSWELREALVGALLTLLLALTGEAFRERRFAPLALLPAVNRLTSRPWVVAASGLLVLGLPRGAARLAQPQAPADAQQLLFVMVDTLRADHVGWLGYERPTTPLLDELVEGGLVFERVVSSSSWTKPAVATMLTGLMPSMHGAVSKGSVRRRASGTAIAPECVTWMEVLRAHGWSTTMWSTNPNIVPANGFTQGVGRYESYVDGEQESLDPVRSEVLLADVRDWLDEQRGESRPFAAYVHLMDPHWPYVAPEPFRGTFDRTGLDLQLDRDLFLQVTVDPAKRSSFTPAMLERLRAIYDEEILYMDHHLAPFLSSVLEDFPNCLVVLVSDHGEEFLEHGLLGHSTTVYEELTRVPLVLWGRAVEPGRVPWQVRLMDIFPTVLEALGVEDPLPKKAGSARSLFGMEPRDRLAPSEVGGDGSPPFQWRAISDGEWKAIRRLPNSRNAPDGLREIPVVDEERESFGFPYDELFHLARDPGERQDSISENAERADALWREMEARGWYFSQDRVLEFRPSEGGLGADPELLRALGYL